MIISSRLLPKTIAFGGQYARQQPCLKLKWRQRVHADISIGSKFEQGDVTGPCSSSVHSSAPSPNDFQRDDNMCIVGIDHIK